MRKIANAVAHFALVLAVPSAAHAWWDDTHMAVMKAADSPYSACLAVVPDALVDKKPTEAPNHYYNGDAAAVVTEAMVREQIALYDQEDRSGHLYGAVVAAWRHVRALAAEGRRPAYATGFLAHYVGDLSQPLHVSAYDGYNKAHHAQIDGIVNARPDLDAQIRKRMQPMVVKSEDDVVREVAALANHGRIFAESMRRGETFTQEQALDQLARSASLLRAMLDGIRLP